MGTPAWLSSALAAADAATQGLGLQEDITIERASRKADGSVDQDARGEVTYDAPVLEKALVQRKLGRLETDDGTELRFRAIVGFLRPVDVNPQDRITLWDGLTGLVLPPQGGLSDSTTGAPFVRLVHLG